MKVYVIRHGITPLNKLKKVNGQIDEPLSQEGIEQARSFTPHVPKTVALIYTSPLLRTRQTAKIIGAKLKLPVVSSEELREIHMGLLAGNAWEEMPNGLELKRKHRAVCFDYRPFGGESVDQVKKRILSFSQRINKPSDSDKILLVTHGGITRLLRFLEQGVAPYETVEHLSLLSLDLEKILIRME